MSWQEHFERARWYAVRVRAMPPAEIGHRLHEWRVRRRWRRRAPGWDEAVGDGPILDDAGLRSRLVAAASVREVAESARQSQTGRLRFLSKDWPAADWAVGAGPAFWLHDPVTDRPWPGAEAAFGTLDLRATGHDPAGPRLGDVKFVWEPARLQILHALAASAAADVAGAAETALAILHDFARTNPPFGGIHWSSGIELALRLVGVTLVCAGVGADALTIADRVMIRRFVTAHATYLRAFPSLHSSANNHRLAEGLGLFLAGRLLPDLGHTWEREGRAILETEAPRLILEDGGGVEQALVYQAFTMEMLAFAGLLAGSDGRPLAAPVVDLLSKGAAFLEAMLDEGGLPPAIGDDDETRVLAQPSDPEPRYVASIVAAVAGLTGRSDLLPPVRDAHLRDALFGVPQATERPPDARWGMPPVRHPGPHHDGDLRYPPLETEAALKTPAVVTTDEDARDVRRGGTEPAITFPQAGYTIVRDTIDDRRIHLVFDHGPLGLGSLAAHGHADALAVWLSVDGVPVLVDAGTYLYHSGGDTRLRLRESPCHNTLVVNGVSQSAAAGAFAWSHRANASLVGATHGAGWSVAGSHDGYRDRFHAHHRRWIARTDTGIAVGDALPGVKAPLPVTIGYLVPDALDVVAEGGGVRIASAGAALCRLAPPAGFTIAIRRGAAEDAVRAMRFGVIEAAQRIVFSGTLGCNEAETRFTFPRD